MQNIILVYIWIIIIIRLSKYMSWFLLVYI